MDGARDPIEQDGFLVLREAVPGDVLAAYAEELPRLRDGLLVRAPGDEHVSLAARAQPGEAGVIDPYAFSGAARAVLLPEAVVAALGARYDGDAPLLFDASGTEAGAPDDGPYRDATYTAVAGEPEALVTGVVALSDGVTVTVFPGSHRIATAPFSGRYRHFNPERDGHDALARHREELRAALADAPGETVRLDAGDVLLAHPDLVHQPVRGHGLVAHFCPLRAEPGWFAYRPERARRAAAGAAWITSQHYDLGDAVEPEQEPTTVGEAELEQVEEALREHDEDARAASDPAAEASPATEEPDPPTPPAGGRRPSGGLMGTVRGLMRRGGRGR
jgi:hypothetical protein